MDLDTTIVAVSSPSGRSSRALVRMSGSRTFEGCVALGLQPTPRQLCIDRLNLDIGTVPVLLGAFCNNASYTGQDTVELHVPNNQFLVDEIVRQLIRVTNGRHAEAGEFTARAFFHGRLSLTEAEGVCATIAASNDLELLGASLLRKGALASVIEPIAIELTKTLALVEAGIDFTDEENVVAITKEALQQSISNCIDTIQSTLDGRIAMATLRNLPHVVLAGEPNSGKSTLFNALLGIQRVVVSVAAGTTRDAIAEPVHFGEKEALLIDIAGIEEAMDTLSVTSQQTAHATISQADLVLWCVAPHGKTRPLPRNAIVVHTKGDIQNAHSDAISAQTGHGLEELREHVATHIFSLPTPREGALAILPRHERCLHQSLHCLKDALENIDVPELTATALRLALDEVGSITGKITPDEVLGQVFSTFCIGK